MFSHLDHAKKSLIPYDKAAILKEFKYKIEVVMKDHKDIE